MKIKNVKINISKSGAAEIATAAINMTVIESIKKFDDDKPQTKNNTYRSYAITTDIGFSTTGDGWDVHRAIRDHKDEQLLSGLFDMTCVLLAMNFEYEAGADEGADDGNN